VIYNGRPGKARQWGVDDVTRRDETDDRTELTDASECQRHGTTACTHNKRYEICQSFTGQNLATEDSLKH